MITFENVSYCYKETNTVALEKINLQIKDGELIFILGSSGSGKSTLLKLILNELIATEGKICVNQTDLSQMRHKDIPAYRRGIGMVFQDFRLLENRTIYENVALAQQVTGVSHKYIERQVSSVISFIGMAQKYGMRPSQISGGEQQKAALARAMVNSPGIILADEPTGNLDPHSSREIMKLFEKINCRGTTVVIVTHDIEAIEGIKGRRILLEQGKILETELETSEKKGKAE